MFIKKIKTYKGRVFVEIVEGFRNENGSTSHKVIEKLGYLDELDDKYGDGISWAKQRLAEFNEASKVSSIGNVTVITGKTMEEGANKKRNIGSLALFPIYKKLELNKVCDAIQAKYRKLDYSINDVLSFFIESRLIDADSRLSSYIKKDEFINNYDFSEEQMYRCMEPLGTSWEQIKDFATRKVNEKYGYDMSITHYDGCNFYFEIDQEDKLRRKGMSKEGKKEPIVNYGMLSDRNLIPIDIVIYPGNESEYGYFEGAINNLGEKHHLKKEKIIYVADRGLNSGDNIYAALKNGNGYIYGEAIRSDKIKKWALLDNEDYERNFDDLGNLIYKKKSWIDKEAIIKVTNKDGKKVEVKVKQKQIAFWSKDYATKQQKERQKLINKAKAFIHSPKDYTRSKVGDAATFVKFATFDKDGTYIEDGKNIPSLDTEAINKQAEMDGFFMVVSSEINMSDKEILDAYSAQKGIERSFRVHKTFLKIRPVYVSREMRIKCHVLVCYLTYLILKLMEIKVLKNQINIEKIIEDLRNYEAALIAPNTYFFFSYNKTVEKLANISGSNSRLETQSLSMIKNLFKNY